VDYALAEMATRGRDPYQVLGVPRDASDEEVRSAYRRLAQLHHPDHNGGSLEAARRFEEVQDAYAEIVRRRRGAPAAQRATSQAHVDPDLERQLTDLERELRNAARAARERARRAAREAAATYKHATDEELGYIHTDDSFGKILADARHELSERFSEVRRHPIGKTVSELIDELASKPTGGGRPGAED
jgi:DnaJ domain